MSKYTPEEDGRKNRLKYLTDEVLGKVKDHHQCDERKLKQVKFTEDVSKSGEQQFQSIAIFGDLLFEYESEEMKGTSVIIKFQIADESSLAWNNGGVQFYNEVYFYDDVLPWFKSSLNSIDELFPKYIYGYFSESGDRTRDFIILENLCKEKFRLATSRTYLSLGHILLALSELGKFHACSYIMKTIDKENFKKKMNLIKNTRNWVSDSTDSHQTWLVKNGERGVKYLENIPEYKDKLTNIKACLDNMSDTLIRVFKPNEKTSVLCHGDFCRNNMFFKYDEHSANKEHPIDVKFFDMATLIYGSPVLDIAFFVYLNTSQDLRSKHFDVMIKTYYNSLKGTTDRYSNILIPTYDEILEEYKMNSIIGYLICSYFLPMMLENTEDTDIWRKLPPEEKLKLRLRTGGVEGTKAIADILIHLIDNGFV